MIDITNITGKFFDKEEISHERDYDKPYIQVEFTRPCTHIDYRKLSRISIGFEFTLDEWNEIDKAVRKAAKNI
jgi:hypothetical protein